MTPGDSTEVQALARALASWFHPLDQMTLAIDVRQHKGFVGERDGHIVGFLTYFLPGKGRAELSWLAVSPDEQGHGLGSELLATLERVLRKRGVSQIHLHTVPSDHDPAFVATNAFYRRHGFEVQSRIENFYSPGRPGLRLVKQLRAEAPS